MLGVAFGDLGGRNAAAVGARGAIDRLLDTLGDGLQSALDEIVAFHPDAKAFIFLALLLPEPLDLHEIGGQLFGQVLSIIVPVNEVDLGWP